MGALFRVAFVELEAAPRPWVALVPRGGERLGSLDAGSYVLGAERDGLPADVLARCDRRATINLAPGTESLNVAMSGTIALYESSRGRSR
jgi:TrmH family RNA methyltransferase